MNIKFLYATTQQQHFAGRAYVGDPCYAIHDEQWSDFCEVLTTIPGNEHCTQDKNGALIMTATGPIFVCGTAHGDGVYALKKGKEHIADLGVDAGLLAIIPLAVLHSLGEVDEAKLRQLGAIINVDGIMKAEDGDWEFGDLGCCTSKYCVGKQL